jgi:hypothetical protein
VSASLHLVGKGGRRLSGAEVGTLTADRVAAYRARRQEEGLKDDPWRTHDAPPAEVSPASLSSWWRYVRAATDASLAALVLLALFAVTGHAGPAYGLLAAMGALVVFLAATIMDQAQVCEGRPRLLNKHGQQIDVEPREPVRR